MKKILKFLSVATVVAIVLTACKKDDPTPAPAPALTTLQKIQAKWIFEKDAYHEFYLGVHSKDTLFGTAGEYVDFRTDNKVYSYIDTDYDTSSYYLLGENKLIVFDNTGYRDTSAITVLTGNLLQLYSKAISGNDYFESTLFLKK